jgi:predicted site-specific integrase-resolvase
MGPVEVAARLGVKPQVIVNWIREGRAHPSAEDTIGRLRFTEQDVEELRAGLGRRRVPPALAPGASSDRQPQPSQGE